MTTTGATDFDIARLRARRTNKWHKFPPDVLPAWVADMDFGVAPSITAALARLTRDQEYGYAARDGVLAAAFVRRMERRFGWHIDPADTIAIGDLVQASFSSVIAFPDYALSSAIKAWYKTGTYGCFCGFERWRATRCNFKRGSARPSLLFFTEQRISAGRR